MKPDIQEREDIKKLVESFYASAANDALLGEIFRTLQNSVHKEELYQYWEAVLLSDQIHESHNFPTHIELMFSARHFVRWLNLFLETIDNHYSGPNAEKAKVIVIRKSEEFQASLEIFRF